MGYCNGNCEYLTTRHNCEKYKKKLTYSRFSGGGLDTGTIHERCSECDKDHWITELEQQVKELTEKLQNYENLGLTPEETAVLKGKAAPMEVTEIHVDEYYCLACGAENNCSGTCVVGDQYCPRCGQRLLEKEL